MSDSPGTGALQPPEEVRPPSSEVGAIGWLNHNLFSSKLNGVLTIVTVLLVAVVIYSLGSWMLFEARWGVITDNMRLFLVGRYPPEEIWRVWVALTVLSLATGLSAGSSTSGAVRMLAVIASWAWRSPSLLPLLMSMRVSTSRINCSKLVRLPSATSCLISSKEIRPLLMTRQR